MLSEASQPLGIGALDINTYLFSLLISIFYLLLTDNDYFHGHQQGSTNGNFHLLLELYLCSCFSISFHSYEILKKALLKSREVILFIFNKSEIGLVLGNCIIRTKENPHPPGPPHGNVSLFSGRALVW